jgi:hypothetical protein
MSPQDATLAEVTAEHCADVLRRRADAWLWRGWQLLGRPM